MGDIMSDYSWIKIGVRAELVNGVNYPELNGTIVTISSEPIMIQAADMNFPAMCVDIEEGIDLSNKVGMPHPEGMLVPITKLKPFNPPNWEGIADGSVKCVEGERVLEY